MNKNNTIRPSLRIPFNFNKQCTQNIRQTAYTEISQLMQNMEVLVFVENLMAYFAFKYLPCLLEMKFLQCILLRPFFC